MEIRIIMDEVDETSEGQSHNFRSGNSFIALRDPQSDSKRQSLGSRSLNDWSIPYHYVILLSLKLPSPSHDTSVNSTLRYLLSRTLKPPTKLHIHLPKHPIAAPPHLNPSILKMRRDVVSRARNSSINSIWSSQLN